MLTEGLENKLKKVDWAHFGGGGGGLQIFLVVHNSIVIFGKIRILKFVDPFFKKDFSMIFFVSTSFNSPTIHGLKNCTIPTIF